MAETLPDFVPEHTTHPHRGKIVAVVATVATAAALGGCAPTPQGNPQPLAPGERVAWVDVTTIPPGLPVRLLSEVTAGPPALVERLGGDAVLKEGKAPQRSSVSYEPGFGTQMVVRAFLKEPPPEDVTVKLTCETFADGGEPLVGADDAEYIDEFNQQTAFVLCVFNEDLAPPLPA